MFAFLSKKQSETQSWTKQSAFIATIAAVAGSDGYHQKYATDNFIESRHLANFYQHEPYHVYGNIVSGSQTLKMISYVICYHFGKDISIGVTINLWKFIAQYVTSDNFTGSCQMFVSDAQFGDKRLGMFIIMQPGEINIWSYVRNCVPIKGCRVTYVDLVPVPITLNIMSKYYGIVLDTENKEDLARIENVIEWSNTRNNENPDGDLRAYEKDENEFITFVKCSTWCMNARGGEKKPFNEIVDEILGTKSDAN